MARILTIGIAALLGSTLAPSAMAADSGAQVFKSQCAICHSGAKGAIGPSLAGVVGRHAGSAPGFNYSPAMKQSGLVWTPAALKLYIAEPAKTVKGNRMPYAGLKDPAKLDAVVAYLAAQR
ncbi:c-type cytochrome [Novosphingobium sp.]|uniref:c-type cytochrome n=1 Tax=Novosphingobium sp. TaxID=1874826 RepID=UPI0025DC5076|nr:c-type cytochrome [Novosphingobium sp.]